MSLGGPKAPAPVDPMRQAEAQMMIEREQRAAEDARRREELARQETEQARKKTDFDSAIANALGVARTNAQQSIQGRGLDYNDFMPDVENELTAIRSRVPNLDANPGSYFSDNIGDIVMGRTRDNRRAQYGREIEQFAPYGFERNTFADTADDPYIDAILGEKYNTALGQVQGAKQRGQLNDTGFTAAMNSLQQAMTGARSKAQQLGGDVLNNYRTSLRGISDTARDRASRYELGTTFNPNEFRSQIDSTAGDLRGRLEGDIRGAIGNMEFFDPSSLINAGGSAQGMNNGVRPLLDAFAARDSERSKKRGLGSEGVF